MVAESGPHGAVGVQDVECGRHIGVVPRGDMVAMPGLCLAVATVTGVGIAMGKSPKNEQLEN